MIHALSIPMVNNSLTPTLSSGRDRLLSAGSALRRAATGFVFVGTLAVSSTFLGPAGLPLTCGLATLAVGLQFLTAARRGHR